MATEGVSKLQPINMEKILGEKQRPPISLREFLNEYKALLQPDLPQPRNEDNVVEKLNLLEKTDHFRAIAKRCSLKQIYQYDDPRVSEFVPGFTEIARKNTSAIPTEALKLNTFQKLIEAKDDIGRNCKNPFKRSYDMYKLVQLPVRTDDAQDCDFFNELIVSVRVYRPVRATHIGRTLEKPVFSEEFKCLGSNLLTDLRDRISCVCNNKHFFDISENPDQPLPTKTSDPGYFFITDTFYNDHRHSGNVDYSLTIRNWAKRAKGLRDLKFKVARMEETRMIDLTVSLGFPQLYQHHGNCEHVFVFSQVEVMTPSSQCTAQSQYPRTATFGLHNNRQCNMCGVLHYVFIVEGSSRQLHDPAYLCHKCFHNYHYIDGKKLGAFRAYRIHDLDKQYDVMGDGNSTGEL